MYHEFNKAGRVEEETEEAQEKKRRSMMTYSEAGNTDMDEVQRIEDHIEAVMRKGAKTEKKELEVGSHPIKTKIFCKFYATWAAHS